MKEYGVYSKDNSCLFKGTFEDCSGMARSPGGFVRVYCGEPIVPVGGLTEEPNSAENHDALLRAFEDSLITTAITIGYEAVNWTSEEYDVHPLVVKTRAARLSLVNYITDLEAKVACVEVETPVITGKCYACVAADILGGTIVQTWAEAKSLTEGKLDGRAKKCSSPKQAREWLCSYLDMPDEYAVDCSADRSPVGIKPENIPSGDELAPQDNSDDSPPWELEKDGRPVDGGEGDRLLDKPPWEVKRSKPFPKM